MHSVEIRVSGRYYRLRQNSVSGFIYDVWNFVIGIFSFQFDASSQSNHSAIFSTKKSLGDIAGLHGDVRKIIVVFGFRTARIEVIFATAAGGYESGMPGRNLRHGRNRTLPPSPDTVESSCSSRCDGSASLRSSGCYWQFSTVQHVS